MQRRTEYLRASNSSLSASKSTASCSSPKVLTQLAALQEAVLTCTSSELDAEHCRCFSAQGLASSMALMTEALQASADAADLASTHFLVCNFLINCQCSSVVYLQEQLTSRISIHEADTGQVCISQANNK